jgi:hypothetical protein
MTLGFQSAIALTELAISSSARHSLFHFEEAAAIHVEPREFWRGDERT